MTTGRINQVATVPAASSARDRPGSGRSPDSAASVRRRTTGPVERPASSYSILAPVVTVAAAAGRHCCPPAASARFSRLPSSRCGFGIIRTVRLVPKPYRSHSVLRSRQPTGPRGRSTRATLAGPTAAIARHESRPGVAFAVFPGQPPRTDVAPAPGQGPRQRRIRRTRASRHRSSRTRKRPSDREHATATDEQNDRSIARPPLGSRRAARLPPPHVYSHDTCETG